MPFVFIYDHRMILFGRYQDFFYYYTAKTQSLSAVQYLKVHSKVSVYKEPTEAMLI